MTTLTNKEIRDKFHVSSEEVDEYLKKRKLPVTNKRKRKRALRRIRESKISHVPPKDVSVQGAVEPWQMAYGDTKVAGVITYVGTRGSSNLAQYYLDVVVTLSCADINGISKLWLDDEECIFSSIGPYRHKVDAIKKQTGEIIQANGDVIFDWSTFGYMGQPANALLVANVNNAAVWGPTHRQDGHAHVYLQFKRNEQLFPDGLPDISFQVAGCKVYDPRIAGWATSSNPALILHDYLTRVRSGVGMAEYFDLQSLIDAANICDQPYQLLTGETINRYTFQGVIKHSDSPQNIIDSILSCMDGELFWSDGKWHVRAGIGVESSGIVISEPDLLSSIEVITNTSREDTFNAVRGTYTAPDKGWQENEFPTFINNAYVTNTGRLVWEDVDYPYIIHPSTCTRLAKILVEKNNAGLEVTFTCRLHFFQLRLHDVFELSYARFGWNKKLFQVQEIGVVSLSGDGQIDALAVQVTAREYSTALFYEYAQTEFIDLTPNTSLPSVYVTSEVKNVHLHSGTPHLSVFPDGTIASRIYVTWDAFDDFLVSSGGSVQIWIKNSSDPDSAYMPAATVPSDVTAAYVDFDVYPGAVKTLRLRFINAVGFYGPWTYAGPHVVVGKQAPPSDVQAFRAEIEPFGVRFFWDDVADADRAYYILKYGSLDAIWDSASYLADVYGTTHLAKVVNSQNTKWFIKAVDTSGNQSVKATELVIVAHVPEAPSLTITRDQEFVVLQWSQPQAQFGIEYYEVFVDELTPTDTIISQQTSRLSYIIKATTVKERISWVGERHYFVRAVDIAGNIGQAAHASFVVTPPGVVERVTSRVIDNNVLLYWSASTSGTLPVTSYELSSGAAYAIAKTRGSTVGTFATFFEEKAGLYSYWIVAVDSAGNRSVPYRITVKVDEPPDFELRANGQIDPRQADRALNVYVQNYGFLEATPVAAGTLIAGSPTGLLLGITQPGGPSQGNAQGRFRGLIGLTG